MSYRPSPMSGLLISGSIAISRTQGPVAANAFCTPAQLAARIDPNPFRSKGAGHRRQIVRADASDRRRIHPPADRAGAGTHLSVVEDSPGHPDPVRNRSGNLRAMHQESPVPGDAYDVFFRSSQGHANGSGDAASHGRKVNGGKESAGPPHRYPTKRPRNAGTHVGAYRGVGCKLAVQFVHQLKRVNRFPRACGVPGNAAGAGGRTPTLRQSVAAARSSGH